MSRKINLFIPELVPLENKGEEAIVRGIADALYPDDGCDIHLLDEVGDYEFHDGLHVYPAEWFVSPWLNREFGIGPSWEKIRDSGYSLLRNSLHKVYPNWVQRECRSLRTTRKYLGRCAEVTSSSSIEEEPLRRLLDCDYVIAGHDGALDERVCQTIEMMGQFGKRFGVFGVELPNSFKSKPIIEVMARALAASEFFYCRTSASRQVSEKYFSGLGAETVPDPAFAMTSCSKEAVQKLVEQNALGEFFQQPVVACTSCETSPIARHSFNKVTGPRRKISAHRQFYADLVKHIVATTEANVLFLPHAIGPGKALDDRIVASEILERAGVPDTRATVLQTVYPARMLKGLIGRAEFLIAERIHSAIGAVGANTPFLCMGSSADRRIKGIVCETVGMQDYVFYLDDPDIGEAQKMFDDAWICRSGTRDFLQQRHASIIRQLEAAARLIRNRIDEVVEISE